MVNSQLSVNASARKNTAGQEGEVAERRDGGCDGEKSDGRLQLRVRLDGGEEGVDIGVRLQINEE